MEYSAELYPEGIFSQKPPKLSGKGPVLKKDSMALALLDPFCDFLCSLYGNYNGILLTGSKGACLQHFALAQWNWLKKRNVPLAMSASGPVNHDKLLTG